MRLSKEEQNAICAVLRRGDPNGKVILFGSRPDDACRGGDIDFYFETEKRLTLDDEIRLDIEIEIEIEDACDSKVNLLIKTPNRSDRPIFKIARKGDCTVGVDENAQALLTTPVFLSRAYP